MAVTVLGFGTQYYGEADLHPDGSFVTTEWITAACLPLIPIRSFRFVRIKSTDVKTWGMDDRVYGLIEVLPLCWAQVSRIYAFLTGTSIWLAGWTWLLFGKYSFFDRVDGLTLVILISSALITPLLVVAWFRRRSFRARHGALPIPRGEKSLDQVPIMAVKRETEILGEW